MVEAEDRRDLEETAGLHDGLSHPARVAILRCLREQPRMPVAELRGLVSERYKRVDTRTVQHHLYKMQVAGLVTVHREGGTEVAKLLRDVRLVVRPATGSG